MTTQTLTWGEAEKSLAVAWPGFSAREPQRTMALAVSQTASGSGPAPVLLAQAGTGVGKSLAYLVPAIASGQRTVVAVSTKALQEQLYTRDLPQLKRTLFPDLTFAMLKGRSNYVCRRAAGDGGSSVRPGSDGERGDLVSPVSDLEWSAMVTDAEGCVGRSRCRFGNECFAELAKDRALAAQVLVVNTSLLTQDLRLRLMTGEERSLLGPMQLLIVDEAHEMPGIVADGLSTQVSLARAVGVAQRLQGHLLARDADGWVAQLVDRADRFFGDARSWFHANKGERTAQLGPEDRKAALELLEPLLALQNETSGAACNCESAEHSEEPWCENAKRVDSLAADLSDFTLEPGQARSVHWFEFDERRDRVALRSAPVEVGGFLDSALWRQGDDRSAVPTVLTSATLAVGKNFGYVSGRLGLGHDSYRGLDVGSPFDYRHQARLYIPYTDEPDPKRPDWRGWAQGRMQELVQATGGGALLLFTSVSAMREAHGALSYLLEAAGLRTFCQYQEGWTNRQLADAFKKDTHSVLFGTRSFMTGVDFPGETCRLVVLDKMPFPVPGDPVFDARCRLAEEREPGSAFRSVSIPEMTLVLVQAFGRLIRTTSDRGVVAVLDNRLRKGWTSTVRRALPPAPVVGTVDAVREFVNSR